MSERKKRRSSARGMPDLVDHRPGELDGEFPDHTDELVYATTEDRRRQLEGFAGACQRLGELFSSHGEARAASIVRLLNERARELLDSGWDQAALNELGGSYPDAPVDWLHPKAAEYQMPREQWQDEVATTHTEARRLAIELRAIASW